MHNGFDFLLCVRLSYLHRSINCAYIFPQLYSVFWHFLYVSKLMDILKMGIVNACGAAPPRGAEDYCTWRVFSYKPWQRS